MDRRNLPRAPFLEFSQFAVHDAGENAVRDKGALAEFRRDLDLPPVQSVSQ
jgi:hypothetical protein